MPALNSEIQRLGASFNNSVRWTIAKVIREEDWRGKGGREAVILNAAERFWRKVKESWRASDAERVKQIEQVQRGGHSKARKDFGLICEECGNACNWISWGPEELARLKCDHCGQIYKVELKKN